MQRFAFKTGNLKSVGTLVPFLLAEVELDIGAMESQRLVCGADARWRARRAGSVDGYVC